MPRRAELLGMDLAETRPGYAGAYAYDDGDKLLSVSSGGVALKTYGYDAAGRTTSVASPAGTTALACDYEGRAVSISGPGVSQTNAYNGLDARVGSTAGGVSRAYLRDGASPTDPLLKDGAATYTPGDSVRSGGATSFLSAGLKSVDAQSSSSQTLSATRAHDAFGNAVSSSGSWSGVFGYGGVYGYQEDATGLKLLGHRYYDPSTGRFLTRDPIKDGRNWYAYVENDPVNGADPEGLKVLIVGFGTADEDRVRNWVHDIGRSDPVLRQVIYDLINDKTVHLITPLPPGSCGGGADWAPVPFTMLAVDAVRVRPDEAPIIPGVGTGGAPIKFPPKVVLAHELGHAWGKEDPEHGGDPAEPGDNVWDVENRYRKYLSLPLRASY